MEAGPLRSRPSRRALRVSIHSDALSVEAEPSQPSPTAIPSSFQRRASIVPWPIIMLELGHWAAETPARPSRATSVSLG